LTNCLPPAIPCHFWRGVLVRKCHDPLDSLRVK
jgi:hypothetical protein